LERSQAIHGHIRKKAGCFAALAMTATCGFAIVQRECAGVMRTEALPYGFQLDQ
jgi:hypothetical protein